MKNKGCLDAVFFLGRLRSAGLPNPCQQQRKKNSQERHRANAPPVG
jgi:hypothetical protein